MEVAKRGGLAMVAAMSSAEVTAVEAIERAPECAVAAGVYRSYAAGFEHCIVVVAQGWPCWLEESDEGHRLLVEAEAAEPVREQLAAYDRESAGWPPKPVADQGPVLPLAIIGPMLWSVSVLTMFSLQRRWSELTDAGALDTGAVFDRGETWRAATALFLHADAAHVISNALGGIFVFSAVVSTLGRWRGWLLVALAAVLGNLVSAAISYPGPYRSLGASTAIFAGLGLLTGRAMRTVQRAENPHRWRSLFVPFAAGFTVLALHGAGGLNVDVGAHVTGFVAGVAVGFAGAMGMPGKSSRGA